MDDLISRKAAVGLLYEEGFDLDGNVIGLIRRMDAAAPTAPCPCTMIEQDEDCPIGWPSLLCGVCGGTGNAKADKVQALAAEMLRIASDLGEVEDPFSAWEKLQAGGTPDAPVVKVKPLEWLEEKSGVFTAWGAHSAVRCWTEQGQGFHVNGAFYPTIEAAKAAAQADYEARILAALEVSQ